VRKHYRDPVTVQRDFTHRASNVRSILNQRVFVATRRHLLQPPQHNVKVLRSHLNAARQRTLVEQPTAQAPIGAERMALPECV
jgi:hypothetical protein